MSFGGSTKDCFILGKSSWTWTYYCSMNHHRYGGAIVQNYDAVYAFGGVGSPTTFEYLPHGSRVWQMGGYSPNFMNLHPMFGFEFLTSGLLQMLQNLIGNSSL